MRPTVTVIVPTFNRAAVVGRAIDSVLGQTYPNCDVLVVDDGSTDSTGAVLARYGPSTRVRVSALRHNRGVTAAKNAGLAAVPSDSAYVGILDSDDELVPDAIEVLVRVFEESGDQYSQVFGWCVDATTQRLMGEMRYREGLVEYDDALAGRFRGEFWQLVRADLLRSKRFDERAAGGESSVWWPLLKERPGWLVDTVVRRYDSSGLDRVSRVDYVHRVSVGRQWAVHAGLAAVGRDLRARYPRRYAGELSELSKWAALAGDRRRALAAGREAIRHAPSVRSFAIMVASLLPASVLRTLATTRRARAEAPDAPAR